MEGLCDVIMVPYRARLEVDVLGGGALGAPDAGVLVDGGGTSSSTGEGESSSGRERARWIRVFRPDEDC